MMDYRHVEFTDMSRQMDGITEEHLAETLSGRLREWRQRSCDAQDEAARSE